MRTSRNSSTSREVLLSCHCGSSFWREEAVAGDEEKQVPRLRSVACGDLAPLDFITTLAPFGRVFWCCNTTREPGKEPTMLIIGCDFHAGFQQVAMFDRTS